MPEAFECFLEANSYEECLRNVMYIGGDTDTLGAIAGAIAEACWGIPLAIILDADEFIPKDMKAVVERFNDVVLHRGSKKESLYDDNKCIKMAVQRAVETGAEQDFMGILAAIHDRIKEHGQAPMPMIDVNNVMGSLDPEKMVMGKEFRVSEDIRLRMDTLTDGRGNEWFPLFTDDEELRKKPTSNLVINTDIKMIVHNGINSDRVKGIVINPFGQAMPIPKEVLKILTGDLFDR